MVVVIISTQIRELIIINKNIFIPFRNIIQYFPQKLCRHLVNKIINISETVIITS